MWKKLSSQSTRSVEVKASREGLNALEECVQSTAPDVDGCVYSGDVSRHDVCRMVVDDVL